MNGICSLPTVTIFECVVVRQATFVCHVRDRLSTLLKIFVYIYLHSKAMTNNASWGVSTVFSSEVAENDYIYLHSKAMTNNASWGVSTVFSSEVAENDYIYLHSKAMTKNASWRVSTVFSSEVAENDKPWRSPWY